tara:strand:- start:38752 stop:39858 length:1107 start_codon:yes stop_codon:yes gene_type:complete
MPTVYLHIGAPKTATSTLQALLAGNSDALLQQGVLYPKRFRHGHAHHVLVCDLIEKYQRHPMPDFWYGDLPRGQAWRALQDEIADHGEHIHSVIISSELFFGQTAHLHAMLRDVREHLQGHEIRIVVYLRRQDELYSSFYNQDVKGVRQWADNAYRFYDTHQIFQLDYFELISAWGEGFEPHNIILRPYEQSQWHDGNIVSDFCRALGVTALGGGDVNSNESLGPTQLVIKQALNRVGFDKSLNDDVVKLLQMLCPEKSVKGVVYINRRRYGEYREQWLAVNQRLSDAVLGGKPLFVAPIPNGRDVFPATVDQSLLDAFFQGLHHYSTSSKQPVLRTLFARAALLLLLEQGRWPQLEGPLRDDLVAWS